MSQDFSKGKIYKITNDFNDDVYVGSSCNTLSRRFSEHKRKANSQDRKHLPLYRLINEIGFERFRIQLIEEYPCEDKYQLRQREGHWIREIGNLNMLVSGRTVKEWYEDNEEKILSKAKTYYADHTEEILNFRKEYQIDLL